MLGYRESQNFSLFTSARRILPQVVQPQGEGWLFAVALGMQERSRAAVWRALLPLGVGHGLAIAAAIAAAAAVGVVVPAASLKWPVALILILMGVQRLFRHRHPRWASMRVSMTGLTASSSA